MEDIIYVDSGLNEIASFAAKCIQKQIPVTTYGGCEIRIEPNVERRAAVKKWLRATKRLAEMHNHRFKVEAYLNDGKYNFTIDENYI